MRCANSFCLIVFLFCIVHLCTALPVNLDENDTDDGYIVEIDPSMLHAAELSSKKPGKYVTAVVRNKRHFDYLDYSVSSEEGNGFGGYVSKPYFRGFAHFWKLPSTIRTGYDYWHPQPTIPYSNQGYNYFHPHHHHHHFPEDCKHPFDDSTEYEDSSEKPDFPQTTSPSASSESVPDTTSTTTTTVPSTTSPTTTTTAPTTTTEYIPVIDIRSSTNKGLKRNETPTDAFESKRLDLKFTNRSPLTCKERANIKLKPLPWTSSGLDTFEELKGVPLSNISGQFIEVEIIPAVLQKHYTISEKVHSLQRRQIFQKHRGQVLGRDNLNTGRTTPPHIHLPPSPPHYGHYPDYDKYSSPPPRQYGHYASPPPRQYGQYPSPSPRQYGQYPSPPPRQYGQYPSPPPRQNGQYPSPPSRQYGQYPSPPSRQYGQYPSPPSRQYGQYPPPPPRQHGQYSSPLLPQYDQHPPPSSREKYPFPSPPSSYEPNSYYNNSGNRNPYNQNSTTTPQSYTPSDQYQTVDPGNKYTQGNQAMDNSSVNDKNLNDKIQDIFGKSPEPNSSYNIDVRIGD